LNNDALRDLVSSTSDLAALPTTVVQLLDLLKDSTCAANEVCQVVERDPAMTANVLKLSNSAFYGARRKIASVRDALVMLGNRSIATLAFIAGMAPIMRQDLLGYGITREQYWGHSLQTAAAGAIIVEHLGRSELRYEAFTAGLVHDIGMLVVNVHLVNHHKSIASGKSDFNIGADERRLLGFDHAEAGAMLARQWGFPEMLVAPIQFHHEPGYNGPHDEIVQAVTVGNILAQDGNRGTTAGGDEIVTSTLVGLALDEEFLLQLRLDLAGNLEETLVRATRPVASLV